MAINFTQTSKAWATGTLYGGIALTGGLIAGDVWGGWKVQPDFYLAPWVFAGTLAALPAFIEGAIQVGQNVGLWRRASRLRTNLAWAVVPALPVNSGRAMTVNGHKRHWFNSTAPGITLQKIELETGQWTVFTPYQRAPVFISEDYLAEFFGFVFTRQNNPVTANDAASRPAWERGGGKQSDYHALFGLSKRGRVVYPLGRSHVLITSPERAMRHVIAAIPQTRPVRV